VHRGVVIGGVAYSADPCTGRRDRVRLTSASGGVVMVDMGIARARVARRTGVSELSDERCLTLARLVTRLEWAAGEGQDPQAVDWSFDGQQLTLGNTRPIEGLPRVSVPLASDHPVLWSRGNLKDAVAGVPTTASWSFIAPYLRAIFFEPIGRLGYVVPAGLEVVRRFEGRAYFDLTNLQAIYFDALGVPPSETNRSVGGPHVSIRLPSVSPALERRWQRARLRALWLVLRQQRSYAAAIDRVQRAARALPLELGGYSNAQLIELAERIGEQQAKFGPAFQTGNFEAGFWQAPLDQLLERWLPGAGQRVAAGLMAGGGRVTSAEHGYRLVELARVAASDAAARAFLTECDQDPQAWRRLPQGSPFKRELGCFLAEFGHRGIYEADLANPRWIEDPRFVLDQVRTFVEHGAAPSKAAEQRQEAERALLRLPWAPRFAASWLARRARRAAALREAGKSALIAMALPVRMILLEFGGHMVSAGIIDQVDDVFHLSRADLETYIRGEWDGSDFRALVAERRRVRESRLAGPPPPDLIGAPGVSAGRTRTLRGLAASPGLACGPARLIVHPSDAARLQRGDILVAPSTDPGWTPLFLRCAAVVTEVGGLLSHGAIVARELGLPAVLNVAGVLEALEDGELVSVDGNRGLIERVAITHA
jgi:rifampicin phosphotransferase